MAIRFTEKKTLTKLVNRDGWKIERESNVGLYAKNEEKGWEIYLCLWNLTLNNPKLDFVIRTIQADIDRFEADNK